MERRIDLTKVFTFSIIGIIIVSTVATYLIVSHLNRYDNYCKSLGGVPVHGSAIDLCLKPDVLLGEENG